MKWLRCDCVYSAISVIQHLHILSQCSTFDGMDIGNRSREQHTMLSVQLKNFLPCDMYRGQSLFDTAVKGVFDDKCGFGQRYGL